MTGIVLSVDYFFFIITRESGPKKLVLEPVGV